MTTEQRATGSDGGAQGHDAMGLGALPVRDIDPAHGAALKDAARQAFIAAHQEADRSRQPPLPSLYHRLGEPALVATLCSAYLGWAVIQVLALYP